MALATAVQTRPDPKPEFLDDVILLLDAAFDELIKQGHTSSPVAGMLRQAIGARPIHLYGALGRAAKLLVQRLEEAGFPIVSGFDRRADEGLTAPGHFPIVLNPRVAELREQDVLILAAGSAQLVETMRDEIRTLCGGRPPQMIDGRKLTYLFQNTHCAALAREGRHEDLMTCISYHTKPFKCDYFRRATEKLAQVEVPQEIKSDGASFNSVGYLISEVCNLRCAQCCEAVPYLDSKAMVSADEVVADLKKLTESIQFLHRLDIVGGEPFAHKEIIQIISKVRQLPGIGYIAVFTNGTLLPPDELCEVLVSDRIIVTNSDYGQSLDDSRREKIAATVEKLRRFGVKVVQIADRYWFDLINFKPNGVSDDALRANYSDCFLESCRRLYRGTLYHCAFQANGIKLGLIPKRNVVELHEKDASDTSRQLEAFEHEPFIDSCHYCALPAGAHEVQAALQLQRGVIPIVPH